MNDFSTYLKQQGCSNTTIESYTRVIDIFLNWCNKKDYDIENMPYKQCTNYINALKRKKTQKHTKLSDTTIKSYVGAIKKYFNYLVNEDIYTVSPLENYEYTIDKDYRHELLTKKELELLYVCFPTLDIKLPNCKHVAIRNKVITGFMVFQGIDTKMLKHLTINHIDLDKRKLHIPGTKKTEPKAFKLKLIQISVLRQYLNTDRGMLQNKINNHSEALFPLNSNRYSIIVNQVMKVLKTTNYKVTNNLQIRASVITHWTGDSDLRTAQRKARHRFVTSTEKYKKNKPNGNREAADVFHVMR